MARGRPREFDIEEALNKALRVFWTRGFSATSLSDLTEATGVGRTGLYAAFGDKEAIFLKALDRYMDIAYAESEKMLDAEPDARKAIKNYLLFLARYFTTPGNPYSCMLINSVQEGTGLSAKIEEHVKSMYLRVQEAVHRRLERAKTEGQLPANEDARSLALFFQGQVILLSAFAKADARREVLETMVMIAMRAWPTMSR